MITNKSPGLNEKQFFPHAAAPHPSWRQPCRIGGRIGSRICRLKISTLVFFLQISSNPSRAPKSNLRAVLSACFWGCVYSCDTSSQLVTFLTLALVAPVTANKLKDKVSCQWVRPIQNPHSGTSVVLDTFIILHHSSEISGFPSWDD